MSIEGSEKEKKTERQKAFILRYSMILETLAITETTLVQT